MAIPKELATICPTCHCLALARCSRVRLIEQHRVRQEAVLFVLNPAAARLIRASLTGDKFATDRILTRAVEADVGGLFLAFTTANLAGRVLALRAGARRKP